MTYFILADQGGKGLVYTLSEMAATLGLSAPGGELPEKARSLAKPAQLRRVKNRGTAPLRANGTKARNALRAQDLLTIQAWRGHFLKRGTKYPDGHSSPGRCLILTMYADFLKGSLVGQVEALAALRAMAANMLPVYPSDPSDSPIESIAKKTYSDRARIWGNKKLCSILGITEDVAREYNLLTIKPRAVAMEADQARPTRADNVQERQDYARHYVAVFKRVSSRQLAKAYKESGFIGSNKETANQDLNAIGYTMAPSRGGRPRKVIK